MHSHQHHHSKDKNSITLPLILNLSFTVIELVGAFWTNSLAIFADAIHDLGDSSSLIVAWLTQRASKKEADNKRTFGYKRMSLLGAGITAGVLIIGSLFVISQAIPRLLNPEPVNSQGMILLAIVGIVFNGLGALKLKHGQSLNERVISWHLIEDVLGWVAVLFSAVAIRLFDLPILDPIITIGFTLFILYQVFRNFKEIGNILLQGVPNHIDLECIQNGLLNLKGVKSMHDVHVWSLEGETDVFTGHVVVEPALIKNVDSTRKMIKHELEHHHIEHSTIEIELNDCGIEESQRA